jgi:hypothetical protein
MLPMQSWLDRMDQPFEDQGFNDSGLKTRFRELFRRNCWMSFEPVEGSLSVLADDIGPNKILMWTTDYLHSLSRRVIVSAAVKPIPRRGRK